jgi:TM2 domain-containing membrane protein YozV
MMDWCSSFGANTIYPFFQMKKYYQLFLALGIASMSLSSCSRSNYSFNTNAPSYLGSEQVRVAKSAAAEETETTTAAATSEAALPVVEATPAHQAARALAHRATAPAAAKAEVATSTAAPAEAGQPAKFNRKAFKQELKRQLAAAPKSTTAEGKSQLVALLLNIFLGGLGIHRFYLGYVGMGILYIALLLTSFLIVPAIALFVLLVIDLIRIITGSLKPKNGEYGKTL